ncbi:hypothetical protein EPA93_23250 [Ktedonosporobacter rubrisoli]|uniref:Uncharacterized protein n=1 Tax=Ktedonosporobacter rubrisoli TaxID=2509675 RepID=A0A4V0YZ75_KTERU|nr:hypothetical protein [Ktedonosporobacter rubrisoli]QBD78741.1 hypothetical protein EPA93_23250 [Ktedonosporobacter rubrisoli]
MSEITEIRKRIEENYEAAWRALHAPAMVASHTIISQKLSQVQTYHEELAKLMGEEQAHEIVLSIGAKAQQTVVTALATKPTLRQVLTESHIQADRLALVAGTGASIEYLAEIGVPIAEKHANALLRALSQLTHKTYTLNDVAIKIASMPGG